VSSRLTYVEGRSALAAARRLRRLSAAGFENAKDQLEERWQRLTIVALDEWLAAVAGELTEQLRLRAGDAVQLASALSLADPDLVFATWDIELRRVAQQTGLAVVP
jgi:predicted nucleic acid-binding protein